MAYGGSPQERGDALDRSFLLVARMQDFWFSEGLEIPTELEEIDVELYMLNDKHTNLHTFDASDYVRTVTIVAELQCNIAKIEHAVSGRHQYTTNC